MMSMNFLHEEVLVEILLQLAGKSLVRFKCTSKQWLSLISDFLFAKSLFKQGADLIQQSLFEPLLDLDFKKSMHHLGAIPLLEKSLSHSAHMAWSTLDIGFRMSILFRMSTQSRLRIEEFYYKREYFF